MTFLYQLIDVVTDRLHCKIKIFCTNGTPVTIPLSQFTLEPRHFSGLRSYNPNVLSNDGRRLLSLLASSDWGINTGNIKSGNKIISLWQSLRYKIISTLSLVLKVLKQIFWEVEVSCCLQRLQFFSSLSFFSVTQICLTSQISAVTFQIN